MHKNNGAPSGKVVTLDNMNPHLKKMEYAVRGPLVIRATQIEKELGQVTFSSQQTLYFWCKFLKILINSREPRSLLKT
jgi:hypothetical protein